MGFRCDVVRGLVGNFVRFTSIPTIVQGAIEVNGVGRYSREPVTGHRETRLNRKGPSINVNRCEFRIACHPFVHSQWILFGHNGWLKSTRNGRTDGPIMCLKKTTVKKRYVQNRRTDFGRSTKTRKVLTRRNGYSEIYVPDVKVFTTLCKTY